MHNIKTYQTTLKQTHEEYLYSTHSTQCAKRGTLSLFKRSSSNSLGFSQPSFFSCCQTTQGFTDLALLSNYSASCLCCQFYSTFHCLSVIWITKLQWLFEKLLDISARLCQWWFMQIQDSFIASKIGNSCSSFFMNVNDFSVALCIEIASGKMKLS